jgi:hypothetical protein
MERLALKKPSALSKTDGSDFMMNNRPQLVA